MGVARYSHMLHGRRDSFVPSLVSCLLSLASSLLPPSLLSCLLSLDLVLQMLLPMACVLLQMPCVTCCYGTCCFVAQGKTDTHVKCCNEDTHVTCCYEDTHVTWCYGTCCVVADVVLLHILCLPLFVLTACVCLHLDARRILPQLPAPSSRLQTRLAFPCVCRSRPSRPV